jgi:hypothetical protein
VKIWAISGTAFSYYQAIKNIETHSAECLYRYSYWWAYRLVSFLLTTLLTILQATFFVVSSAQHSLRPLSFSVTAFLLLMKPFEGSLCAVTSFHCYYWCQQTKYTVDLSSDEVRVSEVMKILSSTFKNSNTEGLIREMHLNVKLWQRTAEGWRGAWKSGD